MYICITRCHPIDGKDDIFAGSIFHDIWDIRMMLAVIKMKTLVIFKDTGGRLNKKDGLTRYGDFHVKDKTS